MGRLLQKLSRHAGPVFGHISLSRCPGISEPGAARSCPIELDQKLVLAPP